MLARAVAVGRVRAPAASPLLSSPLSNLPVSICGSIPPSTTPIGSVRFATSKAGGSTKNGRDSQPKFLGLKLYGGQWIEPGNIILRQRGQKYGIVDSTQTVAFGKDWTIYALKAGYVKFWFHSMKRKYYVEVLANQTQNPETGDFTVTKYPIVRVKKWEVPDLLKLPADTPISESVKAQLIEYLAGIHPAHLRAVLPVGVPVIGNVGDLFWDAATNSRRADAPTAASTESPSKEKAAKLT